MSSTLTGVPASIATSATNTLTVPADGDALNAASVNVAFQKIIDLIAILRTGYTTDADEQFQTTTVPTNYKELWKIALPGGSFARLISTPGATFAITINAAPVAASTNWARDVAGESSRYEFTDQGFGLYGYAAGSASPWADGSWGYVTPGSYDMVAVGNGNMTLRGDLTLTAGDAALTAGNVTLTAGNVEAGGDPASNQARLKGKQFIMAGSAPTAEATSKPGADNSVGDATEAVVANSNDVRGRFTVSTGAATTNGVICRVTFNKEYPSTDYEVTLQSTNQEASDLGWVPCITTKNVGYFELSSGTGANKLAAGTTYGWAYHVIG